MAVNAEELAQDIIKAISAANAFTTYNTKREPYVILVNGKRVTLKSGRNVWSGIGAAKNALRNHLHYLFWNARKADNKKYEVLDQNGKKSYQAYGSMVKATEDEWISKHVVYVSLSVYSIAEAKRKAQ